MKKMRMYLRQTHINCNLKYKECHHHTDHNEIDYLNISPPFSYASASLSQYCCWRTKQIHSCQIPFIICFSLIRYENVDNTACRGWISNNFRLFTLVFNLKFNLLKQLKANTSRTKYIHALESSHHSQFSARSQMWSHSFSVTTTTMATNDAAVSAVAVAVAFLSKLSTDNSFDTTIESRRTQKAIERRLCAKNQIDCIFVGSNSDCDDGDWFCIRHHVCVYA